MKRQRQPPSKTRTALLTIAATFVGGSFCRSEPAPTRPQVSQETCPLEIFTAPTRDGRQATGVLRKPPGKGSFPAVIYLHGGLTPWSLNQLKAQAAGQTLSRFLAAGYVTVTPTFRTREIDPLTKDALVDCLAVIEHVKKMPEVDPASVVLWGDSGGGSLVLELAGETALCAVTAQEPATVLFTGMYSRENLHAGEKVNMQNGQPIMRDPQKYFTPELQKLTREKIRRISCPVFIAHGDKHIINKINNELFIPALKEAGKNPEIILYPGENHGFSNRGTPAMTRKFFDDCHAFFLRHLPTKPRPLDPALLKDVPLELTLIKQQENE